MAASTANNGDSSLIAVMCSVEVDATISVLVPTVVVESDEWVSCTGFGAHVSEIGTSFSEATACTSDLVLWVVLSASFEGSCSE